MNPVVTIKTNMGSIDVELDPEKAPKTVANFLDYVKSGHYDGTVFHRVIAGFMIQGGGMDKSLNKKPTKPPVVNEAGNNLKNLTGTIAMARTMDPDSATSQFFINVKDNGALDRNPGNPGYTVFGKVTSGMDVVKKNRSVTNVDAKRHEGRARHARGHREHQAQGLVETMHWWDGRPARPARPARQLRATTSLSVHARESGAHLAAASRWDAAFPRFVRRSTRALLHVR